MDTKNVTDMYDTVNFTLFQYESPNVNFIETVPKYLTSITSDGFSNQGRFITGYLGSYRVSINNNRIKIQNSSLAKFINNDNQQGMFLQTARRALEKMSDALHLNMDNAKVTRLDLGKNIITKHSPETYLAFLADLKGYRRLESGEGLYYKNSLKQLVFYNKKKEQKVKRQEILPVFENHHLLRYELRLLNHLENQLNENLVNGKLLYNEEFYIKVFKLWRDLYFKISKRSNKTSIIAPTTSTKGLASNLSAIAISEIGESSLLNMVANWQEQGLVTKKQAADLRKFIRETVKQKMKESGNEFIEELDKKIKDASRFFI